LRFARIHPLATPPARLNVKSSTVEAQFSVLVETVARPKIESVGLFKNGLCVVKFSFSAEHAGEFLWEEPPRAVHGIFSRVWLGGGAAVTVRKVMDAEEPTLLTGNLQTDLAGAMRG
jgi:hypothetical protein